MGTGSSKTTVENILPNEVNSSTSQQQTNSTFTNNSNSNNADTASNNNKSFGSYDLGPPLIPPLHTQPPPETQGRKESKNPLSFLGRAFGKGDKNDKKKKRSNRKVVDLDSSESDTDTDVYEESHKKGLDNKLKNDIEDLESTFVRLGLDENGRMRESGGGANIAAANTKGRGIRLEKINQNGGLASSRDFGNGYPPSSDSDRSELNQSFRPESRGQNHGGFSNGAFNSRMEKSALKFSWDQDKPSIEKEDRWTLSKVKIDGFDPEKFRVANTYANSNNNAILFLQPTNNTGSDQFSSLPGVVPSPSVPRYDPMEQQLLASIERELDW